MHGRNRWFALAAACVFAAVAGAATLPTAVSRGRVLLKGAFGAKTTLSATALDDFSTGGTDGQDQPIAITAKYLKLLTRNAITIQGTDWQESVELDCCDYTAQLKVVNAEGASAESPEFRISVAPLFVDVTSPESTTLNTISSSGYWRYSAKYMFDNVLPISTAQTVASLATISDSPSVTYFFKTTAPVVVAYSVRPLNTAFVDAATAKKRAPKKWTFFGSLDGTSWTELDSRSGQTDWNPDGEGEIRYFGFVNAVAYSYYKLQLFESNGNSEVGISEVEFYTEPNEMLRVQGEPSNYLTPTPAYGTSAGHLLGDRITFDISAQLSTHAEDGVRSGVVATGKRVLPLGYRLENGSEVSTVDAETLTDYAFPGATRLTWLWQEQYRLGAQSNDETGGSVVIDTGTAAASCCVWKNAGATTDVRAVPAPGYAFSTWSGDMAEDQKKSSEITLTHDKKRDLTAVFVSAIHIPTTITWTGKGTGTGGGGQVKAWDDPANWDLNTTPGEGDTVVISQNSQVYVTISAPPPHLKKLSVTGAVELRLSGWETKIDAETVEFNGATVVRPAAGTQAGAADTNRVWIVCRDFTLGAKATINADSRGFYNSGPGTPMDSAIGNDGSSHGGRGGAGDLTRGLICGSTKFGTIGRLADPRKASSSENDSLTAPVLPGSGGFVPLTTGVTLAGGGAVRIEATGRVTVNGLISADGDNAWNTGRGGSAGGSVYISCATVDGSGFIRARGGIPNTGSTISGGGGGGRVSVVWSDSATQATLSPTLDFDLGGRRGVSRTDRRRQVGEPGTLYLRDASFYPRAVCGGGGRLSFAMPQQLDFTDLTITNSALEVVDGSTLTVSGNLTLQEGGELIVRRPLAVGGNVVLDGKVTGKNAVLTSLELWNGASLTVGGSMTLSDSAELQAQCGVTNAPNSWGLDISVAGDFTLGTGCGFFPESQPFDLATGPARLVARNITIAAGATVDGVGAGWQIGDVLNGSGHIRGHGPGASVQLPGASHAGLGGRSSGALLADDAKNAGVCYGRARLPLTPGSASAGNSGWQWAGTAGGGQIALFAAETVTLDGSITMSGVTNAASTCPGAGSGGSIYIEAKRLRGAGSLAAVGGDAGKNGSAWTPQSASGNPGKGGGGGGGYITIRAEASGFTGTHDVSGGNGYYNESTGEDHRGDAGVVSWYLPKGGMKLIIR